MRFSSASHTDVGIQKKTNQDSLLILQADTGCGPTLLAVVCDGLGGLEKGELASATVVRAFSDWFMYIYPGILAKGCRAEDLQESWAGLVSMLNQHVAEYGARQNCSLGTTLEALLLIDNKYYIFHIGDCRVYRTDNGLQQLTNDQTFVQQQISLGSMTPEQAKLDPRRNVLLQCIGASAYIQPDFLSGSIREGQSFLLCSDGFRHQISLQELDAGLPRADSDEATMKDALVRLTETCKQRGETDNITSILVQIR